MNIKALLSTGAALLLVACSNNDVVSVNENAADANAIKFRAAVPKSRGAETNIGNLSKFWVTAFKGVENTYEWTEGSDVHYKVFTQGASSSDDNSSYVYSVENGSVTWPDYELKFFASNIDKHLTPPTDTETQPRYQDFSPNAKIADQVDFVYASNMGARTDFPNTVPFDFKHALSQIEIKAKCDASAKWVVKVKGYRISNVYGTATFVYGAPASVNGEALGKSYQTEYPKGEWSGPSNMTSYASGFKGGYGYNASHDYAYAGISDNSTDDRFIKLDGTAVAINKEIAEGTAMLVPQTQAAYNSQTRLGTHIDLLVQVDDTEGNPIYPALVEGSTTERISYRGLPKYYGYVSVAVPADWTPGVKYIYTLDLTHGLGIVDPEKPDVVDPGTYDPADDPDPGTGDNPDPGTGKDPFDKDQPVVKEEIQFDVTTGKWDPTVDESVTM